MITHQTPEQILQAATPEQKILWNEIFLKFGERVPISQFYYCGLIAGSEFLTYSANKLYFGYDVSFSTWQTATTAPSEIVFYDELNATAANCRDNSVYWDVTAAGLRYIGNKTDFKNLYFSRILQFNYLAMRFIGYRLSI